MEIRFLENDDIDRLKWDSCVHYAMNGSPMGYKWYLNALSKSWGGFVEGDYESVMPVFFNEKNEVSHPSLLADGGIYSVNLLSPKRVGKFYEAFADRFSKYEYLAGASKQFLPKELGKQEEIKDTFLHLNKKYEALASDYAPHIAEAVEKGHEGFQFVANLKPEILADFYKNNAGDFYKDPHYYQYMRIMYNALHRGMGSAMSIQTKDNKILALTFILYSHHQALVQYAWESSKGAKSNALTRLFDFFLQTHEDNRMTLRFQEGINPQLDGLSFGAEANPKILVKKVKKSWFSAWG